MKEMATRKKGRSNLLSKRGWASKNKEKKMIILKWILKLETEFEIRNFFFHKFYFSNLKNSISKAQISPERKPKKILLKNGSTFPSGKIRKHWRNKISWHWLCFSYLKIKSLINKNITTVNNPQNVWFIKLYFSSKSEVSFFLKKT